MRDLYEVMGQPSVEKCSLEPEWQNPNGYSRYGGQALKTGEVAGICLKRMVVLAGSPDKGARSAGTVLYHFGFFPPNSKMLKLTLDR